LAQDPSGHGQNTQRTPLRKTLVWAAAMGCRTSKPDSPQQKPDEPIAPPQDAAQSGSPKLKKLSTHSRSCESLDSLLSTNPPPSGDVQVPSVAGSDLADESYKAGLYEILQDGTCVDDGPSFETAEIAILGKGTIVNVLEVLTVPGIQRVRARIDAPRGWVSLLDVSSGHTWAVYVAEAPITVSADAENPLESIATTALALEDDEVNGDDIAEFQINPPGFLQKQQLQPPALDGVDTEVQDGCDVMDIVLHKTVFFCMCQSARRVHMHLS